MTDRPQHTPGPWKAVFYRVPIGDTGDYDDVVHIRNHGGSLVAIVEDCNAQEANAALIARAPELLARVEELERERDAAIAMLANWCIRVDINGSGWDDWDEAYKNAMHRPCSIRSLLDTAIAKERKKWKEEYGRE